jgi:uncharacterized repeat protein (TIGR03943 family)
MTLSVRSARLVVLATWSAFLAWLWLDGEVERYLGPRTAWVVPFGAIVLTGATIAYGRLGARSRDAALPLSRGEAIGLAWLLVPALVGFSMADATLGALAASRKLSSRGIDASRLADEADRSSLLALNLAGRDEGFAAEKGLLPGRPVSLEGFVLRPAREAGGSFRIARLYITCCVADAIPLDADVVPAGHEPPYGRDTWLRVAGPLERRDGRLAVRAVRVRRIPEPGDPYLTFAG